jgi:DeoR family suf operon transcriptional repressor
MGVPLPVLETGLPTGHKGQRGAVLTLLKREQPLTARELAATLGISLSAVRHHLKELEAEALIVYRREHRGVGAPVFAYSLSPAGEELFPRRYGEALSAMLGAVVERDGREAAVGMLESYFDLLARRIRTELEGVPQADRLGVVARLLSQEGYMAEVRPWEGAADRFPEICAAEVKYLADVLGAEVERTGHILSGCPACEYRVRFSRAAEESS